MGLLSSPAALPGDVGKRVLEKKKDRAGGRMEEGQDYTSRREEEKTKTKVAE